MFVTLQEEAECTGSQLMMPMSAARRDPEPDTKGNAILGKGARQSNLAVDQTARHLQVIYLQKSKAAIQHAPGHLHRIQTRPSDGITQILDPAYRAGEPT